MKNVSSQQNPLQLRGKDLLFAAINGALFGAMVPFIAKNLGITAPWLLFVVSFSLLAVIGISIGFFLSRWMRVIYQFSKFAAIGAANFAIDLGVFNLLIFLTKTDTGVVVDAFKGISFVAAVVNSYFWNKYWAFAKKDGDLVNEKEFLQFFLISFGGFLLNVAIVHLFVNILGAPSVIDSRLWANIAALTATIVVLFWNFLGYKLIVFRR